MFNINRCDPFELFKMYTMRQDTNPLKRPRLNVENYYMTRYQQFVLENVLLQQAKRAKQTCITEDHVRMEAVRFCNLYSIPLPPDTTRRMSKRWFHQFIAYRADLLKLLQPKDPFEEYQEELERARQIDENARDYLEEALEALAQPPPSSPSNVTLNSTASAIRIDPAPILETHHFFVNDENHVDYGVATKKELLQSKDLCFGTWLTKAGIICSNSVNTLDDRRTAQQSFENDLRHCVQRKDENSATVTSCSYVYVY